MNNGAGKGSDRRPQNISNEEMDDNWALAFKKKCKNKKCKNKKCDCNKKE